MANIVYAYTAHLDEVPAVVTDLSITETLNEFSTLSFSFVANDRNKIAAEAMLPQTRVLVPEIGQWFRLSNVSPSSTGDVRTYQVSAVHVGTDLHDRYVENKLTGSQSLDKCMKLITNGTSFKYVIHDKFNNYSFSDGFGGDYADSLLMNTLKDDFKLEFYLDNWTIHIYKKMGQSNQFVFIDGYNASKIQWTEDYSNIRTKIKGLGKQKDDGTYEATAEYNSPAQTIWGVKQAATIQDDRFTDNNSLLNYIKSQLQDYPTIQYTVERAEFEHHAKLSDINNVAMGNSGFIKDRLGVDVDVRIIGMTIHPQDAKQTDTVTFGNTIFDYARNYNNLQKARKSNEALGKTVSKMQINLGNVVNAEANRKLWVIGTEEDGDETERPLNNIIALGDSITQGWTGTSTVPSWKNQVAQVLNVPVDSTAVGGSTLTSGNAAHNFLQQITEVDFAEYSVAVVFFGINDFNYYKPALQDLKDTLATGIKQIKDANPFIEIYGILPIQSWEFFMSLSDPNSAGWSQNDMLDAEAEVYQQNQVKFLDWRDDPIVTADNRTELFGDGVTHPTASTYVLMGNRIAKFIGDETDLVDPTTINNGKTKIIQYSDASGKKAYAYTHWQAIKGKPDLNVLESPNGDKFELTVDDNGKLTAVKKE